MQTKESLESWYKEPDPWKYRHNPDDFYRLGRIIKACMDFEPSGRPYRKALDIGCGEGWITSILPAVEVHGYEISDTAAARFPERVIRATDESIGEDSASFDLVLLTGVLYRQYDWKGMLLLAEKAVADDGVVVSCNIKSWIKGEFPKGELAYEEEFAYRGLTERLTVHLLPGSSRR